MFIVTEILPLTLMMQIKNNYIKLDHCTLCSRSRNKNKNLKFTLTRTNLSKNVVVVFFFSNENNFKLCLFLIIFYIFYVLVFVCLLFLFFFNKLNDVKSFLLFEINEAICNKKEKIFSVFF